MMMKQQIEETQSVFQLIAVTKYYILMTFLIILAALIALYGVINIYHKSILIGSIECAVSLSLIFFFFYAHKTKKISVAATAQLLIFESFAIFLYKTGGINDTGIFWLFLFPVAYYFFKGSRQGTIWFSAQILIMATIFTLSKLGMCEVAYNAQTTLVAGFVLIIQASLLFTHEKIIYSYTSHVKVLQGLLPICASCKKIRDDKGYWNHLEQYIETNSEADFTHGICPSCIDVIYPEIKLNREKK